MGIKQSSWGRNLATDMSVPSIRETTETCLEQVFDKSAVFTTSIRRGLNVRHSYTVTSDVRIVFHWRYTCLELYAYVVNISRKKLLYDDVFPDRVFLMNV